MTYEIIDIVTSEGPRKAAVALGTEYRGEVCSWDGQCIDVSGPQVLAIGKNEREVKSKLRKLGYPI